MLRNANSSVSEDEPMEYTEHSSVTHNCLAGLDTIIQSINKRYEVYQKRRTAATPFSTPAEVSLGAPPTPRSILGDSSMVNASSGGGSGGSGPASKQHSTSQHLQQQQQQPTRDPLAEPIVVAHAHPSPYWEERELYIVAEDLCCYLNGGINYRLLCEQYQRALEVLLTLVKEDFVLCASGAVEVLPGGTTRVMMKLQALLKESRKMLEDAGVDVPPKLSRLIDQLPSAQEDLPVVENPPAFLAGASSGFNNSNSNNNSYVNSSAGAGGPRSPRARPPSALTPARRQPPASGVGVNDDMLSGHDAPPRVPSAGGTNGSNRGRPQQPRNRASPSTPDATHFLVHFSAGNAGSGTLGVGNNGTGTRRNTPGSTVVVDPPVDGSQGLGSSDTVNGPPNSNVTHDRHSSILLNSTSLPSSAAPTPLSGAAGAPSADSGRCLRPSTPQKEEAKKVLPHEKAAVGEKAASRVDDSAAERVSPIPSTPPRPLYDGNTSDRENSKNRQQQPHNSLAQEEDGAADQATRLRGRLRLLEELYGEHYALDGMRLLTDALGVVFTREYSQGPGKQYQNSFAAFQRDVNNKVMPALKSYEALQLRITELTPLRSTYLASCLARRVRPNDTVLEQLKRIDHDRTPETLLLGGLHLGDLGAAAVVESIVPRLYRLRTLSLSDNNLHDGVLELLFRAVRYHPALETLDLSRNPITDNGVPFLLRMAQTVPRLSSILLQSSSLTSKGKQMVETEVATPGTYAVSISQRRRPVSSPLIRATSDNNKSANDISGGINTTFSITVGNGNTNGGAAASRVGAVPALTAASVSAPWAPHPPMAHRPPSSLDGRNRWMTKPVVRAESMPTKLSSAIRKVMVSKGNGSTSETKLPPLPRLP